eukprot:538286_1
MLETLMMLMALFITISSMQTHHDPTGHNNSFVLITKLVGPCITLGEQHNLHTIDGFCGDEPRPEEGLWIIHGVQNPPTQNDTYCRFQNVKSKKYIAFNGPDTVDVNGGAGAKSLLKVYFHLFPATERIQFIELQTAHKWDKVIGPDDSFIGVHGRIIVSRKRFTDMTAFILDANITKSQFFDLLST